MPLPLGAEGTMRVLARRIKALKDRVAQLERDQDDDDTRTTTNTNTEDE